MVEPHRVHRAEHAVQVLLEDMMLSDKRALVDASSLVFVLRACGFEVPTPEAAQLGAVQAVKVWEYVLSDATWRSQLVPQLSSFFYSLMLQTIRHLPPSDQREHLFAQIWHVAAQMGKVNVFVLQEFLAHAKPARLVTNALGAARLEAVRGLALPDAARSMVAGLPTEWTQHADGGS